MNRSIYLLVVIGAAIAAISLKTIAQAATIRNLDPFEYKVVIVEGSARQERTIAGQQEVTGLCQTTCNLYIADDPEAYDITAQDKMEIANGELFYQEQQ